MVAFDALLREAEIPDALIVQHMGHLNERARGDSRLRDWPEVEWRLVRQDDQPGSTRYLTAYGRDVDAPETQLAYDAHTRRLTIVGGTRHDASIDQTLTDVLGVLNSDPISQRAIIAAVREAGATHRDELIREAVTRGIQRGLIATEHGPRRAILHRRISSASQCGPSASAAVVSECGPPYIGGTHTHTPRRRDQRGVQPDALDTDGRPSRGRV